MTQTISGALKNGQLKLCARADVNSVNECASNGRLYSGVAMKGAPSPARSRHAPNPIIFSLSIRRFLIARKRINPPAVTGASRPEAMVNKPITAAASPIHHCRLPALPKPSPTTVANAKMFAKYHMELIPQMAFSPA